MKYMPNNNSFLKQIVVHNLIFAKCKHALYILYKYSILIRKKNHRSIFLFIQTYAFISYENRNLKPLSFLYNSLQITKYRSLFHTYLIGCDCSYSFF